MDPDPSSPPSFADLALPLVDGLYQAARAAGADDAVARSCVETVIGDAVRRFHLEGRSDQFKVWIFMALRHVMEDRGIAIPKLEDAGEPPPPSNARIAGPIETQALQDAVGRLPSVQRLLLVMCDRESMSYREAAAILNGSAKRVADSLRAARRAVRDALAHPA